MKMDKHHRQELIRKIKEQSTPGDSMPAPIVSLEDFFMGNDDIGSIGCNTNPGGPFFYTPLKAIRDKQTVQDVLIEICEVEEDNETIWPFSERIYILSSSTRDEVAEWLAPLEPDTVEQEGYVFGVPKAAPKLQDGMKIYAAWWD